MKQKMSERSAKWLKKRSFLDQREEQVKTELSEASDTLEVGVKKVLMASAAVGATVLTGYMIYKAFSKKKKKPVEPEIVVVEKPKPKAVKKKPTRRGYSLKSAIIERVVLALIQILSTQLAVLLSKNKTEEKSST